MLPASRSIIARPSIRHDGRVLAVGTDRGVVLWDLARGTELAFLPIGNAWHLMFEPSGDLLTSGSIGVQRWPIQLDPDRGEFRIGPPRQLPLPAGLWDRRGPVGPDRGHGQPRLCLRRDAGADDPGGAARRLPRRRRQPGRAMVGDRQSSGRTAPRSGASRDGAKVAELPIDGASSGRLQPRWEMADDEQSTVPALGGRHLARGAADRRTSVAASPPTAGWWSSRMRARSFAWSRPRRAARSRGSRAPTCATCAWATFSPDGSRLVVTTNDGPAVHVWDLRAIRKHLAEMGLDWDAPAYSDDDPAGPSAPPLPPLQVDFGPLAEHLEHFTESPAALLERYTARLKNDPNDADAYHHRAHALISLRRFPEAIDDLTQAIRLRPDDAHFGSSAERSTCDLKQLEPAIADLEAALAREPDQPVVRERLALCCNNRAWELANGPEPPRDLDRALALARRAVELAPGEAIYLNTLGVVQYRAGRYAEAIATLERSLAAGHGQSDAFDLFFLAMAHHRLGHRDQARDCFDRAVRWLGEQKSLTAQSRQGAGRLPRRGRGRAGRPGRRAARRCLRRTSVVSNRIELP